MTTRNTKEVALVQFRTGNQAEMPKALQQSEPGLAKDTNRLFIGNTENSKLANRTVFPYQNLEILTEFSELKDYFKYSYENNITNAGTVTDRAELQETTPIVVTCTAVNPTITASGTITVNGKELSFTAGQTMTDIINVFNSNVSYTKTYATELQSVSTKVITFVCLGTALVVTGLSSIIADIGYPSYVNQSTTMPVRKITEKLDDTLHITDFGVKGDGTTNYSSTILKSLIEVYDKNSDKQFFRSILFPAGKYVYSTTGTDELDPFPLISNEYIKGEGIDRTIIEADYLNASSLMLGLDSQLNISTNSNYGTGSLPENIFIEDMTFDCGCNTLCVLKSVKNITFNRVKFIGESGTTLINILGTSTNYAQNITFNSCIFESANIGINISEYAKNVTIQHSRFDTLATGAIIVGNSSVNPVSAVNINDNLFTNCATSGDGVNPNTYVIKVMNNAKYVSVHQSQFDQAVIERTGSILPYGDLGVGSRKNYCDVLDPNTDTKKVLMFNFTQPEWKYLDKLADESGNVVLGVNVEASEVTSTNGLMVNSTNSLLTVASKGTGDLVIAADNDADIIIGEGLTTGTVNGNIIFRKNVEIGGGGELNPGDRDLTIKLQNNHIAKIDDSSSTTPYKDLIGSTPNAIPNVAYVNSLFSTVGSSTIMKHIKYTDITDITNAAITLATFDSSYGSNVHITKISVNVRSPFYEAYDDFTKAVLYTNGYKYYRGDLVTDGTNYGVVITEHTATSSSISNANIVALLNSNIDDIRYADIIGTVGANSYSLTQSYESGSTDNVVFKPVIDLKRNNNYSNGVEMIMNASLSMPATTKKNVLYAERIYQYKNSTASAVTVTPAMLHDSTNSTRFYDEGYEYEFTGDKNMLDLSSSSTVNNIYSQNWAGGTLKMTFLDSDASIMQILTSNTQLNPSGEIVVTIQYHNGAV